MAIHTGTGHAENETYNNKKGSKERSGQKYCFWMKSFKLETQKKLEKFILFILMNNKYI